MVTKTECDNAVYNGADWYCVWCMRFYPEDSENVITDHEHGFDNALCERCDSDMIDAKTAYKYD